MINKLAQFVRIATRKREWLFLSFVSRQMSRLSSGDRMILIILGTILVIVSVLGLYAFERSFLVRVPTYGGIVVEGELGSPRFVNPLMAISDADRDITSLTYSGLMGVSGNGKLIPILAKSYSVSSDGKVYTFILKQDIHFSDGTPITANDVVFTVHKAQDPTLKSPQLADWSGVTVSAINSRTVQFTLQKPYAPFLENTTLGILPERLWQNIPNAQFPFTNLAVKPVGAGPFVVQKIVRDSSGIITEYDLRARKDYVLGRPYLNGITFKFYTRQADLALALESGNIDSAYGVPSKTVITAPFSSVFGVFFNADKNPVLANKEIRKALSLSIDRKYIVKNVLNGYATPLMGPIPPGSNVSNTPVPNYKNTIKVAAKVLTDAGWTYDGIAREWKNKKKKAVFSEMTIKTSNVPELKEVATAVRKFWQKLGISVSIELYEPGDLNQNVIRPRKYEALLFGMVIGRDQDLFAFWHSSQRNDPGLNIALYANKTVDALLKDSRTVHDPKKRLSDLNKIEKDISSDYPAAFTHTLEFVYSIPKNLSGVKLPQINTPSDRFSTVTKWYMHVEYVWPFLVQFTKR